MSRASVTAVTSPPIITVPRARVYALNRMACHTCHNPPANDAQALSTRGGKLPPCLLWQRQGLVRVQAERFWMY